jgi:wyosine [tRNA(Phe)-imidazoG37] synthetase (radical SAM superfamily)
MEQEWKCVYGPVSSWRLGRSLGIDLISSDKTCSFDCSYCQIGDTVKLSVQRKIFIPTNRVESELNQLPDLSIDYITFSGTGEPTLALNLGEVISLVKSKFVFPTAVLTNSSLMHQQKVRQELGLADVVMAKLDSHNEDIYRKINCPHPEITFGQIIQGIKQFAIEHPGKLVLQIMLVKENIGYAEKIAELAKEISPAEVAINTPLRPSHSEPLSKEAIEKAKKYFNPIKTVSVFDANPPKVKPINDKATSIRRPSKIQ